MRILVTGGAGFIGSNFIRFVLARPGFDVVNLDKLTYAGNLENLRDVAASGHYRFVHGDIVDPAAVRDAMQGCHAVVHFAAESHVDRSIYDPSPAIETNIKGTLQLMNVARDLRIQKFVHVSTDEVYGDMEPGQWAREDFPLKPNSPYAASKAGSDLLVQSFVRTYSFPAVITRASNNYGPYQFPEKLMPLLICNALEKKPLPIYGDGLQERDWLHVEDHCAALLRVLEDGVVGQTYNIGGGNIERNLDVARRLLGLVGQPQSLLTHVTDRPGHDRRYALDCRKIGRELGWHPQVAFDMGLQSTVAWYRDNADWIASVRGGDYQRYYDTYYVHREASLDAVARSGKTRA